MSNTRIPPRIPTLRPDRPRVKGSDGNEKSNRNGFRKFYPQFVTPSDHLTQTLTQLNNHPLQTTTTHGHNNNSCSWFPVSRTLPRVVAVGHSTGCLASFPFLALPSHSFSHSQSLLYTRSEAPNSHSPTAVTFRVLNLAFILCRVFVPYLDRVLPDRRQGALLFA